MSNEAQSKIKIEVEYKFHAKVIDKHLVITVPEELQKEVFEAIEDKQKLWIIIEFK